jgi:hypothetical protein
VLLTILLTVSTARCRKYRDETSGVAIGALYHVTNIQQHCVIRRHSICPAITSNLLSPQYGVCHEHEAISAILLTRSNEF